MVIYLIIYLHINFSVPVGVCPSDPDWKYVAPYCYYHSNVRGEENRLGWDAAEQFCMNKGGHLVSIESETENRLIVEMVSLVEFDAHKQLLQ